MAPFSRSRWCRSNICERLSCQLCRKLLSSSSMLMISILCLETSCSEGPWPNDSRGVGWVSMSSRTTVAVLTLVSDNKKVDFEWVCVYPSASGYLMPRRAYTFIKPGERIVSWDFTSLLKGKFRKTWLKQSIDRKSNDFVREMFVSFPVVVF